MTLWRELRKQGRPHHPGVVHFPRKRLPQGPGNCLHPQKPARGARRWPAGRAGGTRGARAPGGGGGRFRGRGGRGHVTAPAAGPSCSCGPLPRALFHQPASSWINLLGPQRPAPARAELLLMEIPSVSGNQVAFKLPAINGLLGPGRIAKQNKTK